MNLRDADNGKILWQGNEDLWVAWVLSQVSKCSLDAACDFNYVINL